MESMPLVPTYREFFSVLLLVIIARSDTMYIFKKKKKHEYLFLFFVNKTVQIGDEA